MCNGDAQTIMKIFIDVLDIIHFFVPIVLIIFCTMDIFKIVVSKKEDEVKKLRNGIFRKIIYAIIIYVLPFLIPFILSAADKVFPMDYDNSWKNCYDYVKNSKSNE